MSATVLCLVFSVAAVSQAPASSDSATPAERQKALLQEINRRNAKPEDKAKTAGARQVEAEVARRKAVRRGHVLRDRQEFERSEKLQAQAREEYRRMLPFLLEKQRLQLERMSAYERNVALNRIAVANEASARAINNAANAIAVGNNNGFRTLSPNATPYGPYGFGGIPAVQGNANFVLDGSQMYNKIGGSGASFP